MAGMLGVALLATPMAAGAQFSESYNFLKAVKDRDGAKVNEAIGDGASTIINTRDIVNGDTALHIVVKRRDATWLSFLLSRGANPNLRDKEGNTPLLIAATVGFAEGIGTLLDSRAVVDLANGAGETPLIRAVQNRDIASVRLLVANGANPKLTDASTGMSARDYAERDGRSQAILKILDEAKPKATKVMGPSLR